MIYIEVDKREERITLENRLLGMQKELNKVQKDNLILKMKSTIALGQMRLQVESIQEDKQFLIEKFIDLKKKVEVSEQSLKLKNAELATLQSMMRETWKWQENKVAEKDKTIINERLARMHLFCSLSIIGAS
jgi:fructose-1,6-bisphosphatase